MKKVALAGKGQDNPIYEPATDSNPSIGMYASIDNVEYEPYNDSTANDKDDPSSFYNQPHTHPDVGFDKRLANPDDEAIYESIK